MPANLENSAVATGLEKVSFHSNAFIEELMLLNCGVGEDSWVPWTARRSNQSILNIHWKDWCWSWNSNTLATWCKQLTHLERPWCWEGLRAGGEGDNRGWDGWMASPTQRAWVWVNCGSWWWTGGLVCCSPWGHKESDTTEQLNWSIRMHLLRGLYDERSM